MDLTYFGGNCSLDQVSKSKVTGGAGDSGRRNLAVQYGGSSVHVAILSDLCIQ